MNAIKHEFKHEYQPTNSTCGYASLAMLLSHYHKNISTEELLDAIPHPKDENGKDTGSITMQLVAWCQSQGIQTQMYSFDMLALDLSWKNLTEEEILKKLKASLGKREAKVFSRHWVDTYVKAYIDMIDAGGKLSIMHHLTTKLLYDLLLKGPVYINICSTVSTGKGRTTDVGLRKSKIDDENGHVSNHSILIYGNDTDGNFLIGDPWYGKTVIDPETMLCAVSTAQIECDNQCFIITKI